MVPTMILVGLVVGILPKPWYLVGLLIAAAAWPMFLVATEATYASNTGWLLRSFALSAINVAVGLVFMRRILIPTVVLSRSLVSLLNDRRKRGRL